MTDKFFTDDKQEDQEDVEKIKLGEDEFTQEELQELIGSGRRLKEIEQKQGQPIDEILTSWGKRGERIGEYKKTLEERERELERFKNPPTPEQVDKEKIKEQVLEEARNFGILTRDEFKRELEEYYQTQRAGERMLIKVNKVLRDAKRDDKPVTTPDKLLDFMQDPSNPKDPEKAYKLMFEKELDDWRTNRINSIKKSPMKTEAKSTAGAKEFTPPKVTRENLKSVLRDYVSGGEG